MSVSLRAKRIAPARPAHSPGRDTPDCPTRAAARHTMPQMAITYAITAGRISPRPAQRNAVTATPYTAMGIARTRCGRFVSARKAAM